MEEENISSSKSNYAPVLDIRKSDYSKGADENFVWTQDLLQAVCCHRESLVKTVLFQLLNGAGLYEPKWWSEAEIRAKYPRILTPLQIAAMTKKLDDQTATEITQLDDAYICANSTLIRVYGPSSIDILKSDKDYKLNQQKQVPNPMVTLQRFMCTHITEREGKGVQKVLLSKLRLVTAVTEFRSQPNESVMELSERFERTEKALVTSGVDINLLFKDEQERTIKFLYSLDPKRYGGLIRDISNGVLPLPVDINALIVLAKERRELSTAGPRIPSLVANETSTYEHEKTNCLLTQRESSVLTPMPKKAQWSQMSERDKAEVVKHNGAISKAAQELFLMGWCRRTLKWLDNPPIIKDPKSDTKPDQRGGRGKPNNNSDRTRYKGKHPKLDKSDKDILLPASALVTKGSYDSDDQGQGIVLMVNGPDIVDLTCDSDDDDIILSMYPCPSADTQPTVFPNTHPKGELVQVASDDIVVAIDDDDNDSMPPGCYSDSDSDSSDDSDSETAPGIEDSDEVDPIPALFTNGSTFPTKPVQGMIRNRAPGTQQHLTAEHAVEETEPKSPHSTDDETYGIDIPPLDEQLPRYNRRRLIIQPSMYRVVNDHRRIVPVGDGLFAMDRIPPCTELVTFVGTEISGKEAADMSPMRGSYLINISEDGDTVLDCYHQTQLSPPGCLGSFSNTADGLYDRHTDTTLTIDDNNAAVQLVARNGRNVAVLYSIKDIPPMQEILWDYGIDEDAGTTTPPRPERQLTHGQRHCANVIATMTATATPFDQHPGLGFTKAWQATDSENECEQPIRGASTTNVLSWDDNTSGTCLVANPKHPASPFDDNHVLLDCGSGLNICKSRTHASNIKECQPGSVTGIQSNALGSMYNQSCNFIDPALGRMAFLPSAVANIISLASAKDKGFSADYSNTADNFNLTSPSGVVYTFERMHMDNGSISKFYVMRISSDIGGAPREAEPIIQTNAALVLSEHSISTVRSNLQKYTVRQVSAAQRARQFLSTIGNPPLSVAIQQSRNMTNIPVNEGDIKRCYDIYGPPLSQLKGSTKRQTPTSTDIELGIRQIQVQQCAEVDLMFARGCIFVITILSPLEFSILVPIKEKSVESILPALEHTIRAAEEKGYKIQWVKSDGEPAMKTTEMSILLASRAIEQETLSSGDHAPKVERRIQFVKEKLRGLIHSLPYTLCTTLSVHAAIAANRFTNIQKASSSTSELSPREKFLGRRYNFKTDGGLPFGTYVQVTQPNTDNSDRERTEACIYLYPTGNANGACKVYKIHTGRVVSRTNVKQMAMPDVLCKYLSELCDQDLIDENEDSSHQPTKNNDDPGDTAVGSDETEVTATYQPATRVPTDDMEKSGVSLADNPTVHITTVDSPNTDDLLHPIHIETKRPDTVHKTPKETYNDVSKSPRRSSRISNMQLKEALKTAQDVKDKKEQAELDKIRRDYNEQYPYWHPISDNNGADMHQSLLTSHKEYVDLKSHPCLIMTCSQAVSKHGDMATDSIEGEIIQLLDKDAFYPTNRGTLTKEELASVISSKMFVKEKLLPSGKADKIKSRLVARGDQQIRESYAGQDLSASTASSMSVLCAIAIAVYEKRKVKSADIGGAYLNAGMSDTGPQVLMRIEPRLAAIMIQRDPRFSKSLGPKGDIIVRLKKCLYGCIESAKRWQDHVTAFLISLGYTKNTYEPCVMNKIDRNGCQITVVIYVDDLLITCVHQESIDDLIHAIKVQYKQVQHSTGNILDYLGMTIDMSVAGQASITMDGMTEAIVKDSNTPTLEKRTSSPATDDLFDTTIDPTPLSASNMKHFHTIVARLAYLARLTRPELLLAVSYLVTRVTRSTDGDIAKLYRVIRYLHQSYTSGHRGIVLRPKHLMAAGWMDASYAIHENFKSHSACNLSIGETAFVSNNSTSQTIITKSSTEAELVCVSDNANRLIHLVRFLTAQGHKQHTAIIYQDNMSTMALLQKGRSTSTKSKHIAIRFFWIKEQLDSGLIQLEFRPTAMMGPANLLTKPLQGAQFIEERLQLTGWK